MTYIENIFVCVASPLLIAMLCMGKERVRFFLFCLAGMGACLLSAYINSFFSAIYQAGNLTATAEIAPVVEEVMKLLPLLFYLVVFEPNPGDITSASLGIAVGFGTFENVCYLTENGAESFSILLIRGISAGALHILCGIAVGYGVAHVFRRSWIALTGTVGVVGACIVFHGVYNLLISGDGGWKTAGYLFPSGLILILFILKGIFSRIKIEIE